MTTFYDITMGNDIARDAHCDMIVMAMIVNKRNTWNTDSPNVYIPKPNIECHRISFKYAVGKIWNDFNILNDHQWRHLNMPVTNLILNTGTLTKGSYIINERFCIILMCIFCFVYICHIICIVYIVYNHTWPNWITSLAEYFILYKYIEISLSAIVYTTY